jgi:flagellar protein FliJ
MPTKKTLQQLIELARLRSDTAARSLGVSRSREETESGKLKLLEGYRDEYSARLDKALRNGLDRGAWDNYRLFLLKIDAAFRQQRELLEQSRKQVEQCRSAWQAANGKVKSFETLDRRRQRAEHATDQRREQREQDELASRKHTR